MTLFFNSSCMGGFCQVRGKCANYRPGDAYSIPVERICDAREAFELRSTGVGDTLPVTAGKVNPHNVRQRD